MIVMLFAVMSLCFSVPTARAAFLPELTTEDIVTADHFSNNLWGLHDKLEEKLGLSFEIVYLQDMFWNTRGGLNPATRANIPAFLVCILSLIRPRPVCGKTAPFF